MDYQLRLTQSLIKSIGQKAKEQGADLLIVAIPSRGIVNPKNPHYNYALKSMKDYWDAGIKMLNSVAEDNSNIELLNTTPKLKKSKRQGYQVYGEIDVHCNKNGYRVIARSIYEKLVKEGYIKSNPQVDFSKDYSRDIKKCP